MLNDLNSVDSAVANRGANGFSCRTAACLRVDGNRAYPHLPVAKRLRYGLQLALNPQPLVRLRLA